MSRIDKKTDFEPRKDFKWGKSSTAVKQIRTITSTAVHHFNAVEIGSVVVAQSDVQELFSSREGEFRYLVHQDHTILAQRGTQRSLCNICATFSVKTTAIHFIWIGMHWSWSVSDDNLCDDNLHRNNCENERRKSKEGGAKTHGLKPWPAISDCSQTLTNRSRSRSQSPASKWATKITRQPETSYTQIRQITKTSQRNACPKPKRNNDDANGKQCNDSPPLYQLRKQKPFRIHLKGPPCRLCRRYQNLVPIATRRNQRNWEYKIPKPTTISHRQESQDFFAKLIGLWENSVL